MSTCTVYPSWPPRLPFCGMVVGDPPAWNDGWRWVVPPEPQGPGWKCPNCGRGMAPWMPYCDCVKPQSPTAAGQEPK